ncbi:MAG: hypothetical protein MZV49_13615 [Rhodopseudomonas palustris]|nr:hypothetical protein [Rhodopseudomonas palustris]
MQVSGLTYLVRTDDQLHIREILLRAPRRQPPARRQDIPGRALQLRRQLLQLRPQGPGPRAGRPPPPTP